MFLRAKKTIVVLIAGIGITAGGVASASAMSAHEHHVNHVNHQARKARQAAQVQQTAPVHNSATASQSVSGNSAKDEIARRESGGNYNAVNPTSGATGKYQCLPSAHGSCPTDPAAQEAWADSYVAGRYGSWENALAHHNANGWY